ncbi:MAG TPA: deoxynucleoside kinase [Bacteroidetes bacterium]|nr:deoxynucleoside kinase [Bacteroidota bacterium]
MVDPMKYQYIVVEGNIGAGKTSLTQMIAAEFNARLILEEFSENPFLPKFYKNPERYAFPLELSFLAARYQQLKSELENRDLFKTFTISDYYFMKSLIFARVTLAEEEFKLYRQLFHIIYQSLPRPDLFVYLHVTPRKLIENIRKRGRDYEQEITYEYLQQIQDGYFDFFRQETTMRFLIIDTENVDFVNRPDDFVRIRNTIFEKEVQPGLNYVIL